MSHRHAVPPPGGPPTPRRCRGLCALLVALVGCDGTAGVNPVPPPGTQIGQEGDLIPCDLDEAVQLDFSAPAGGLGSPNDVFGDVFGTTTATATPPEGTPVDFDLRLTLNIANSTMATHWFEVTPDGAETVCEREGWILSGPIEIDGDPAFVGTNHGTLEASTSERIELEVAVIPTGGWQPATLDPADWAQLELVLTGVWTGSWSGELTWVGTNPGHSRGELAATWTAD